MMNWKYNLIKALAAIIVPGKMVGKGIVNIKQKFQEGIDSYILKLKLMVLVSLVVGLFLIFASISIALVINHYLDSYLVGFVILGSFYLIISIILISISYKELQ